MQGSQNMLSIPLDGFLGVRNKVHHKFKVRSRSYNLNVILGQMERLEELSITVIHPNFNSGEKRTNRSR